MMEEVALELVWSSQINFAEKNVEEMSVSCVTRGKEIK